jgi:replication factor C large subunit
MAIPLIEKYRIKKFEDIKGQDVVVQEVRDFFHNFPKKKALILNGPVGTGKTSMVLALAASEGLELFELNASDLRNRSSLEEVLRPSIEQQSLFNKGKLILMDEADGITGTDRGGVPELVSLIGQTTFPIIITANDIWQKKFSPLRKKCKIVNLKELTPSDIKQIIIDVLHKEGRRVRLETLNKIAIQSRGDVRAALNDLESVLELGEEAVIEVINEREKQSSIFDALKTVFQGPSNEETLRIFDDTQMQLDEILLWVEENIPLEYQNEALAKAYEALSRADIFKGRIYRQQYWRFLVYQSFFLSGGISAASKEKRSNFVSYKKPSRILKIWMANMKNAKSKAIVEKYASFCHMSKKKAMKEKFLLPFILDELDSKTRKKMDLDEAEIDYLLEKKGGVIVAGSLNRFRE